jgi:hypothetical protein
MSENDILLEDEKEAEGNGAPAKGIPKAVWFIGGGLLVIILAVVAAWYFYGSRLFGGGDPIAEITPGDALFYMSFDFLKLQTEEVADIFQVFQEMSDEDAMSMTESLDEYMGEEFSMSFSEDVMPWVGQYAAFTVLDVDFDNEEYEYMFVVEARNKGEADNFISTFVEKLDQEQGMQFTAEEKEGIMLYTHEVEYGDDMFIARDGSYIYFANTEDSIFNSTELKREDSLASSEVYINTLAKLPDNRMAVLYLGENFYQTLLDAMAEDLYYSGIGNLENLSTGSIGMSASAQEAGLQFDFAVVYDEENLSDYQKELMAFEYLAPETDKLVPEDTFLYFAMNRSELTGRTSLEDNPFYTEDMEEAFELLERDLGISLEELIGMFDGEFAFALAPALDGVLAELGEINMGFTLFASTSEEAEFTSWFGDLLDIFAEDMYVELDTQSTTIGDYELEELIVDAYDERVSLLYYGASNGYIIIGSSEDMLEDGLSGETSLADNETYQNTWNAFSSSSIPYMYVDVLEIIDFIKDNTDPYTTEDINESALKKMPVVAAAINQPSEYTYSTTLIFFIETGE